MTIRRSLSRGCLALTLIMAPSVAGAQDSLRILRFSPASPASLREPIVVAFDHPVAPELDRSVDPTTAVTVTPAGGSGAYWRDPSTLIVEFNDARPYSPTFTVTVNPRLKSADGLPLARRDASTRTITVRSLRVMAVATMREDRWVDPVPRLKMMVESHRPDDWTDLRVSLLAEECGLFKLSPTPLSLTRVRAARGDEATGMPSIQWITGDSSGRGTVRVLEMESARTLPRGCGGTVEVRHAGGDAVIFKSEWHVRPPLSVDLRECTARDPCTGELYLSLSAPVAAKEVRAHVRLDGAAPIAEDDDGPRDTWYLGENLVPGVHTLTISGRLHSTDGDSLGANISKKLFIAPRSPAVAHETVESVLPRGATSLIRIRYSHTDSVIVVVGRSAGDFIRWGDGWSFDDNAGWRSVVRDSVVLRYATRYSADTSAFLNVPIAALPAAWRDTTTLVVRAIAIANGRTIGGRWYGRERDGVAPGLGLILLRRSATSVHAMASRGDVRVWVTSLAGARAVAGAAVGVMNDRGDTLARATTDAAGMARLSFPSDPRGPVWRRGLRVDVRHGDDHHLLRLQGESMGWDYYLDGDDLDLNDDARGLVLAGGATLHGSAFSDRAIYRPGERVFLKGVVRGYLSESGYSTPRGDSARWVVRRVVNGGSGDRAWTRRTTLGEFGSAVDTFVVPVTARLGEYTAVLSVVREGRWHRAASLRFAIAEYRVPEFAVRVTADSSPEPAFIFAGAQPLVFVAANYLFGLPMQGAKVDWWAEVQELDEDHPMVPGLAGLTIGRSRWPEDGSSDDDGVERRGTLVTDANGNANTRVPVGPRTRPGRMTVHATVTDANRQTVTSDVVIPVHVANAYVGARLTEDEWYFRAGRPIEARALVVGLDGSRRAGLQVRAYALQHTQKDREWRSDTVWRDTRISTTDTLRLSFTPKVGGQYELVIVVRDESGREAATGLFAWVPGFSWPAWKRLPNPLVLRADRSRYTAGDSAVISVQSPAAGPAWIVLTDQGILWQRSVRLARGANQVIVPIPAHARSGVKLSVSLRRARAPTDTVRAYYAQNELPLDVVHRPDRLQVTIRPDRAHVQPRDTVHLRVTVRNVHGKALRSEIAVWAVDQGVASLTAMERPSLLDSLLASRGPFYSFIATSILGWTPYPGMMRRQIPIRKSPAEQIPVSGLPQPESLEQLAGGPSVPGATMRERFSTTPLYVGAAVTDSTGTASIDLVLLDNITTFRLFAVAIADGVQTGSADTSVVSSRTLAVRTALPRIIRDGDSLSAGALVTQDRNGTSPVTLTLDAQGIRVTGTTTRTDSLHDKQARELRFDLRGIAADTAVLRFRGNTARDADAVEARLPVSPGGHPRAMVTMGTLSDSALVGFQLASPLDGARSRLELQVGSSLLPVLQRLSESLRLYPFQCTEQLVSGGRAALMRIRAERLVTGTAELSLANRSQLEMRVALLVNRQRDDGGIGYWSSTSWTWPSLTVSALEYLSAARSLGVAVPEATIARARTYLTKLARSAVRLDTLSYDANVVDSTRVMWRLNSILFTLRSMGTPDTAAESRVLAGIPRYEWFDRLWAAHLLAARGDSARARRLLADAWRSTWVEGRRIIVTDSSYSGVRFPSRLEKSIELLLATIAVSPRDMRIEPLFESVLLEARDHYLNTVDQGLLADAVFAILRRRPSTGDSTRVVVSTRREPNVTRAVGTAGVTRGDTIALAVTPFVVSAARARDSVVVRLTGDARRPVYYAATLLEVPRARPVRADDEGISVERWYERFGSRQPIVAARLGELVRVRIRITVSAERAFVAIEDPLPAGLEAVDLSLRTSSTLPPNARALRVGAEERASRVFGAYGSWDGGWWVPWEHRELHDDRVSYFTRGLEPGSYLISYVARATTAGVFVRPPAYAEEMYNPAVRGRSDGGVFTITP